MIANMRTAELEKLVGGLSEPSKMPCYGYSLPAKECKVGSLLRNVKGSTCGGCYALKGRYVFPTVQTALYRRLAAIDRPDWIAAMTELIRRRTWPASPYFRWHDSGDLQSLAHLKAIVEIAKNLPSISFWLPTRETAIVKEFLAEGKFPRNLTVRVSAQMIGRRSERIKGTVGSSVENPRAYQCPAPSQGNHCGDCRECWNRNRLEVSYHKH